MTSRANLGAAPVPGVARLTHRFWPTPGQSANDGSAFDANGNARQGNAGVAFMTLVVNATGTGVFQFNQGTTSFRLRSAAAADDAAINPTFYLIPLIDALPIGGTVVGNPMQSYRVGVVASYPALPGALAANADLGLQFLSAPAVQFNAGAGNHAGIMFGPTNTNVLTLQARRVDGGPITFTQNIAPTPTMTNYNFYELQITGAVGGAPAQLFAFVNGIQVAGPVAFGAAAGLLPDLNANVPGTGGCFRVYIRNATQIVYDCFVKEVHCYVADQDLSFQ
jgi:hypothetical protein